MTDSYVEGIRNERLFTFLFFKFINLKFSIMNKKFLSVLLFFQQLHGVFQADQADIISRSLVGQRL